LSPSIIPIPSLRALPSVSPSPSASRVANSNKPSGSTPSVSGTPVVGTRFKVSVKSWNMNGNKFEGRSVYLKLCDDSECKDVVNSYPVIETGTLNFDVAKKLTMPKIVGKEGQYIKVVDSVSYLAPATSESGEDILVELSSSVKRIVKNTNNSPGANPGTSESANLSENDVNENQESTSVESAVVSSEMNQQTNFLPTNLIIAILGILILVLLIVVIMLMKRKNK
jgi:cobalamin biosynthesis Mg chelatase CobN